MDRPRTRGDCKDGPRPCPWVSCAHHMAHIVPSNASRWTTKSIVRDDEIDPEDVAELIAAMENSCVLDIADRGEHTLEQIGELLGVTRERVRQVLAGIMTKGRRKAKLLNVLPSDLP